MFDAAVRTIEQEALLRPETGFSAPIIKRIKRQNNLGGCAWIF